MVELQFEQKDFPAHFLPFGILSQWEDSKRDLFHTGQMRSEELVRGDGVLLMKKKKTKPAFNFCYPLENQGRFHRNLYE